MKNNRQKENSKVWSLLNSPLIVSIIASTIGSTIGSIIPAILLIIKNKGKVEWEEFLVYLALIFVAALVFTLISFMRKDNNDVIQKIPKELVEKIIEKIETQNETTLNSCDKLAQKNLNSLAKLKEIMSNLKQENFKQYLLTREELENLEGSVEDGCNVYVQTSMFELENTPKFKEIIVNNLRKGAIYHYLVQAKSVEKKRKKKNICLPDEFESVVKDCWKQYSSFLNNDDLNKLNKDNSKENWNAEYKNFLDVATKHYENSEQQLPDKKEVFSSFINRFHIYYTKNISYAVTIVLYEVKKDKWRAIVKLPTKHAEKSDIDEYSYSVFGKDEVSSTRVFVKDFKQNFGTHNNEIKKEFEEM